MPWNALCCCDSVTRYLALAMSPNGLYETQCIRYDVAVSSEAPKLLPDRRVPAPSLVVRTSTAPPTMITKTFVRIRQRTLRRRQSLAQAQRSRRYHAILRSCLSLYAGLAIWLFINFCGLRAWHGTARSWPLSVALWSTLFADFMLIFPLSCCTYL